MIGETALFSPTKMQHLGHMIFPAKSRQEDFNIQLLLINYFEVDVCQSDLGRISPSSTCLRSPLCQKKKMGLAMKMDEKVPVIIPITKTKAKSLIIPAPKIHRETAANRVVKLVIIDLDKTRLIAIRIIFRKLVTGLSSEFFPNTIKNNNGIVD